MEKIYTAKLTRVGSSLAVVVPKDILRAQKLERGDTFVFGVYDENVIVMRKISDRELAELRPKIIRYD